ncbi:GFA family protein [Microbulbifer litoralis]|uniref:GFA family protein n=1 Tax=Microbulbifer litoralis TaxID=2933965 RepID=UPI002027E7D2|nr:GFA family protein [Microbulbifer sp. GX H0434]
MTANYPLEGGCGCGHLRYRMNTAPLVVHCCHCRWCQRETGTAFVINAMIESDRVTNLNGEPQLFQTPSESGRGQRIARCPKCLVAVWSHYAGSGHLTKFVRVGTLDDPGRLPPDVHIYTGSKQPWVEIPGSMPAYPVFYEREDIWRRESLERLAALEPAIAAYKASLAETG